MCTFLLKVLGNSIISLRDSGEFLDSQRDMLHNTRVVKNGVIMFSIETGRRVIHFAWPHIKDLRVYLYDRGFKGAIPRFRTKNCFFLFGHML